MALMASPAQSPLHNPESEQSPQFSSEAERAIIGALLFDNSTWDRVADRLFQDDFYHPAHRVIFSAIADLELHSKPFDVITVGEKLEKEDRLADIGGPVYLAQLTSNAVGSANVVAYSDIIRDHAVLRKLSLIANDLVEATRKAQSRDGRQIIEELEQRIFAITAENMRGRSDYQAISELVATTMERIDELHRQKKEIIGVPTGFTDLDQMTNGLQESDLIIVAGRPSMGKTALAMNIVENAVIRHKKSAVMFSLEMSGIQLAMRTLSSLSRLEQRKVQRGQLAETDWPSLMSTVALLDEAKLFIDDTPSLSPVEMRARCRRIARIHGLDLVVVDYLQLMQASNRRDNRVEEISEISRSLKALARELNVPVIALSQLNRGVEQRHEKRPVISDLRDSGAIEQDADLILLIYRDEVYNEDSPRKGMADINIAKQRNGPTGQITLTFSAPYTRFENFSGATAPEYI